VQGQTDPPARGYSLFSDFFECQGGGLMTENPVLGMKHGGKHVFLAAGKDIADTILLLDETEGFFS
jgi:hypothetical protein